jgi:hypothetical protein
MTRIQSVRVIDDWVVIVYYNRACYVKSIYDLHIGKVAWRRLPSLPLPSHYSQHRNHHYPFFV